MTEENKHIKFLLERFFNGETCNKEEMELYQYFNLNNISDELQKYKPIFSYFENGLSKEVNNYSQSKSIKNTTIKKGIIIAITIAASILLAIAIPYIINSKQKKTNPFEGSYITKNGIKIFDLKEIEAKYYTIISELEEQEKEIDNTIENIQNQIRKQENLIKEFSITNNY